jgi:hypothetical protein
MTFYEQFGNHFRPLRLQLPLTVTDYCASSSIDVAPQQRFIIVLTDQEILGNQGECG